MDTRISAQLDSVLALCDAFVGTGAAYVPQNLNDSVRISRHFPPFCRECLGRSTTASCRRVILSAAHQGLMIGEPGYFPCWLGLNSVSIPVAPEGTLIGAIELGGFFYEAEGEASRQFVARTVGDLAPAIRDHVSPWLRTLPEHGAADIRGLADFVLDALFSSGVNNVDTFNERHDQYLQQRRIAELMHTYGSRAVTEDDVFPCLTALASALRYRERHGFLGILDDFFCRVLLQSGTNTNKVRAHVHLMLALLERDAVLTGGLPAGTASVYRERAQRELDAIPEIADLCHRSLQLVRRYLDSGWGLPAVRRPLPERVLGYLRRHFQEKLTLQGVADAVNASPSSISQQLRQATGHTFHEHLIEIRLEEARHLLSTTQRPLADIAEACGFCDQAHFTRVFRNAIGMPPGRFRRSGLQTTTDKARKGCRPMAKPVACS